MEKKTINDVLKEKAGQKEKVKEVGTPKDKDWDFDFAWWALMLAIFGLGSDKKNPEIDMLKERQAFLEGKMSIIEKLIKGE